LHGREYGAAPVDGGADGKCHGRITEGDALYQETKQKAGGYSDKLDALGLPDGAKLLIDRYVSEHIANGSRYGELAYQLGFCDCAELLIGNSHFKK